MTTKNTRKPATKSKRKSRFTCTNNYSCEIITSNGKAGRILLDFILFGKREKLQQTLGRRAVEELDKRINHGDFFLPNTRGVTDAPVTPHE